MEGFDGAWIAHFVMAFTALILGITIHEYAHAIVADKLGDDTPRSQGRVTLWPLTHLDPLGTLCMIGTLIFGFGFGWGRPVQTDPSRFRENINRRLGMALVAVAGPVTNILIAVVAAAILRLHLIPATEEWAIAWMTVILEINVVLFLFNLLPVYPLDGSHLLTSALPPRLGDQYQVLMRQYGVILFLVLCLSGLLSRVMAPAVVAVIQFLLG